MEVSLSSGLLVLLSLIELFRQVKFVGKSSSKLSGLTYLTDVAGGDGRGLGDFCECGNSLAIANSGDSLLTSSSLLSAGDAIGTFF